MAVVVVVVVNMAVSVLVCEATGMEALVVVQVRVMMVI